MRASFRFSSSAILVGVGTAALLAVIVVLIAGGFVIDIGVFHLSMRQW
jgi:hypothetical protein